MLTCTKQNGLCVPLTELLHSRTTEIQRFRYLRFANLPKEFMAFLAHCCIHRNQERIERLSDTIFRLDYDIQQLLVLSVVIVDMNSIFEENYLNEISTKTRADEEFQMEHRASCHRYFTI